MTARRRIERCDKSFRVLAIEYKDAPIGKPLLSFAESRVEHNSLTDLCAAVAAACRVRFAALLNRRSSFRSAYCVG